VERGGLYPVPAPFIIASSRFAVSLWDGLTGRPSFPFAEKRLSEKITRNQITIII
jgi:hypothetical protein